MRRKTTANSGRKTKEHRSFTESVSGNRVLPRISFWRAAFERLSPSQWVEKHIKLPPGKTETKPGPIVFSQSPYLREIIDAAAMPGIHDVIMVAPTRLGKTFSLRGWFAWFVGGSPAPLNLYDATIDKARSLSRKEIQPLVEYNDVLRSRKPKNRHHFSDTQMLFDGAPVQLLGGNSVAGAAGDTVVVVLGNEVEKWSGEQKGEASMVELVRHRTESHEEERKHFFSSTPSTETGPIWTEFKKGDQRKWFVPCPCCGTMQPLVWEQVRWDYPGARRDDGSWDYKAIRRLARYVCAEPSCGAPWDDKMRLEAVRDPASEWRPTAEASVPGYRSYHLNGLYGPLKVNRIGELAISFLSSRSTGFNSDRRDFWNSRMGQPWLDRAVSFNETRMKESMMPYKRGTLPEGWKPDVIIVGFDVQSYGIPWSALAFKWSGEVRTVDHGLASAWEDLDRVQETYRTLCQRILVIGDIRYKDRRPEVLEEIFRRTDKGWKGAEGFETSAKLVKLGTVNPFLGSNKGYQAANATVTVLSISTYDFKVEWEKRFTREIPLWGIYTPDTDDEKREFGLHVAQLTDERRVKRARRLNGQPEWEWKATSGENHAFDTYVYALSQFWLLQQARTADERRTQGVSTAPPVQRQTVRVRRT